MRLVCIYTCLTPPQQHCCRARLHLPCFFTIALTVVTALAFTPGLTTTTTAFRLTMWLQHALQPSSDGSCGGGGNNNNN